MKSLFAFFVATLLCHWQLVSAAPSLAQALSPRSGLTDKVHFEIFLTLEDVEDVGRPKKTILVNGISPGPALELQVGDSVEFVVHNHLPYATAIHFHGITQLGTPWSDGVPGLSQEPIQPGATFIYRWTADESGTYFYHSHRYGQIADGLYGAIIIYPRGSQESFFRSISNDSKDLAAIEIAAVHAIPIFVSDWTHYTFDEFFAIEKASGLDDYCADATIINGKGSIICPGIDYINSLVSPVLETILNGSQVTAKGCLPPLDIAQGPYPHNFSALPADAWYDCNPTQGKTEVITVDPKLGWARLDFISPASVNTLAISIDEHPLYVFSADGKYIQPQVVQQLPISNGFRYSALIKLDKPVGDYTIRVTVSGINQINSGYATLSYRGSAHNNTSVAYVNYAGANLTADFVAFDETAIVPFEAVAPAPVADVTHILTLEHFTQSWNWTLSGNASFAEYLENDAPLLYSPTSAQAENSNLTIRTHNGTWVDIIIVSAQPLSPPHPIHKHSNKFFVIGSGSGAFNYSSVAEAIQYIPENFNLVNPPQRDGSNVPAAPAEPSWLAIRYHSVNPGAFLLHCHVQTHFSGGMGIAILDGVDAWPKIPAEYRAGKNGLP
ncbi:hypothetical protein A1O3_04986 [Capronia epimyces CBS 606.96]|uniref:L-ascorbate oxidase n=1 Tax=Capronia epimyces CBS 606.96 TaxID=1182542 RepID=W9YPZ0_9EURO|nr:uncharacterized protein A1O3_04986 [Capronia epimyces CBS 606.96]EXJ84319.1 hypothetical protein A1O3_04986 [Capronia epimyces CBS 606.96]